ncbi:MAG TPA: beta-propeller fold lactonase family protein [Acidobacteriaceae bacterium]|nr:beta-propeller fold lactonase family protein [Acidobacteriaceae bacterium]
MAAICAGAQQTAIDLPTSKQLMPVPGTPQRTNSLPMAIAASPDGHYLALLNAGYGTYESKYQQSIAVLDTSTGKVTDFPEARTAPGMPQTLYQGLAFSSDGTHLYASFDSLSAPVPSKPGQTGNAIAVYRIDAGQVVPERLISIPVQTLAAGHMQNRLDAPVPAGKAIPAPAGLAVVKGKSGEEQLLVADVLSDDVLLIDVASGAVRHRFDLSTGTVVPSSYPIAVAATRDGKHGFAALWNGSAVAELDLISGKVMGTLPLMPPSDATAPSSHPTALALSPNQKTLYVALANRDAVAALSVHGKQMKLTGVFDTRLPGQTYFGGEPNALALTRDGRHLYAANAGTDSVAIFRTRGLHAGKPKQADGFVPTEWLPTGLAVDSGHLYIATGKGKGTGPNNAPQRRVATVRRLRGKSTYIATLLYGSVAAVDLSQLDPQLPELTKQTVASNMQSAAAVHIQFQSGTNPIRHVIYIIKENRTYDQIFGDLPAGNNDPSLTMYGRSITPNEHKLAERFGILDNFYDSGEVSGDGHVWSTAAISSDYTEKTWQQSYRGKERVYDFEGVVENGFPLTEKISDVNEPESSYLWTNLARHHKTYFHFAEYIATHFCGSGEPAPRQSPLEGTPEPEREQCATPAILPGAPVPENYGGGTSQYPWAIPLIAQNVATKPELVGHFDPNYPDFQLDFPDQMRFEEFDTYFKRWVAERNNGHDEMPNFVMLRLANDHTEGTRVGKPTPSASIADNDLAVGRAVEAVSHSPYWNDTAFFILEDDAQNGADHVDAHRSTALVISKYAPRQATPLVDDRFYTTVSMIRTMEDLLDLPPMNNNDAFAPPIATVFAGAGDQPPFDADYSNRDNGLIYTANKPSAPGAKESGKMDFRHEDRADPQKLNVILWKDAKGNAAVPAALLAPVKHHKDDDD